ncbi:hypothetical protein [Butyrivibrio proteoclasticus]|uniref:hypothetical protein n=1 Tax=Butyrivibrio proteoclasticus TaxID=43305 RepID=UPI000478DD41|nr:hypothetical protein [Butyrivibrio proteoclasticus]
MAKKQEKKIDEITTVKSLVSDLDAKAFEYCRDTLFDMFGYKFMEKKDFRSVDFCEQILGAIEKCGDLSKNNGSLGYYAVLLEQNIEDYCICVEGERAEKYKNKAISLLSEYNGEASELDPVMDATMIFLSLFKLYYNDGKLSKDKIEDATFTESVDDINLLNALYGGVKSNTGVRLKLARQTMTEERKRFFLIFSTIILAKGLQARGLL